MRSAAGSSSLQPWTLHQSFLPRPPPHRCSCPFPLTTREIQITDIAQILCPEGVRGPRLRNKSVKNVRGRRPSTFVYMFIAQSRPPDPLRTQVLHKVSVILFCGLFTGLAGGVVNCNSTTPVGYFWRPGGDSKLGAHRLYCPPCCVCSFLCTVPPEAGARAGGVSFCPALVDLSMPWTLSGG